MKDKHQELEGLKLENLTSLDVTYEGLNEEDDEEELVLTIFALIFDKGVLEIENPFCLKKGQKKWTDEEESVIQELELLKGESVKEAYSSDKELCLEFSSGHIFSVSLAEEDFITPEAASYTPYEGEESIVYD